MEGGVRCRTGCWVGDEPEARRVDGCGRSNIQREMRGMCLHALVLDGLPAIIGLTVGVGLAFEEDGEGTG